MAGIALLLDLLKKNSVFSNQAVHSYGFFSSTIAASAAAASVASARPFASRFLFGDGAISVALCDAGTALGEDYVSNLRTASGNIFNNDNLKYTTKEYPVDVKPLFSAFELKALSMTSLRSFLMFYLPILERKMHPEEDDDFLQYPAEEEHVHRDVLKKSVKQIIRETAVVTTRRILERLAVHYVSQRMAWKLLKDLPKSAKRKAQKAMPTYLFFYNVTKSTFRGHLLGVAASWIVQVGIEMYRYFSLLADNGVEFDRSEQIRLLGKKVSGVTVRCGASLVFASIGAGIGAILFQPSTGQWIGCAVGDLAGPFIVAICVEKVFHVNL